MFQNVAGAADVDVFDQRPESEIVGYRIVLLCRENKLRYVICELVAIIGRQRDAVAEMVEDLCTSAISIERNLAANDLPRLCCNI